MKPKVCILRADGINCDEETFYAFEKFGGEPEYVHINQLRSKIKHLKNYQILAIPGGFAYGDDVVSGKILATELVSFLKDQIQEFVSRKKLILGICNGFQVLVRTGLLPFNHLGEMDATLAQNESGHFECRFVKIKIQQSCAIFLKPYVEQVIDISVNHGEGKFFSDNKTISKIEKENLVFCRYVDQNGRPTQKYPPNPNGALNAIAGITDPTGRILGLMPHPEKIIELTQHPNWRRGNVSAKGGLIFESMVKFAQQS
ncbi:phosphoribosylformylglycinamidine synthase I [Candidatus Curtissbacteria bacterium RIFCSPHIGHO2_01_FULL_41_11]|uniref:Phosphoribosylformylglycinamidine synthase I n=1 Tax=Candidatus Curtissbacteria bacterium RIFCSPHIGHO2_01_FULL_41_11 TaxID=1797711 RepID=A0A1F5G3C9_9BACT|nr:MAG: phosphoribosylformylglycinamidine synthase I [Candidatus Curtissbacteria bacterium RIFCSPHIGHO2_01_FULL_41_11]